MIRAISVLSAALLLAGCDSAQRMVQSATGTDPAARCASAETYAALNQILYNRVWPGFPGDKRPSFRSVAEVSTRVHFERPVLDGVDPTSGIVHCSADLVIPDALVMAASEAEIPVRFRQLGDALVTPIKYDIVRTADTATTMLRLDHDADVAQFVRDMGSTKQSEMLRQIAKSERDQAERNAAEAAAANATAAASEPSKTGDEVEPMDTRDEALGENHL